MVEKDIPSKQTHKQGGVAILISDKVDFRQKSDNEGHFILIKRSIHKRKCQFLSSMHQHRGNNLH
jgi:hypothetical protein